MKQFVAIVVVGMALATSALPSLAQRAGSRPKPPSSGGPTPPPAPTNPIPPRPSSSGVAANNGIFVTSTFPRTTPAPPVQTRLQTRPLTSGPVAPPTPIRSIVRTTTDP